MKIQKKIFKIQIVFFVLFGLIVFSGLYETTPIQMIESQITGRGPASVASTVALKSVQILKVDCASFNQEIPVPARQVRLEGYLCDQNNKGVTIRNETTGKIATLFNRGKSEYMTDFIQLKEGKNQITLSYLSKKNSLEKIDLTIIR